MNDTKYIKIVWSKGAIVPGYNPDEVRIDVYGSPILFSHYGNRNSKFGWEIDHIIPKNNGGLDSIFNFRPLQWENNLNRQIKP